MARTTSSLIQEIMEVDTTLITTFTPFITVANRLVTKWCSTDDYSTAELTEIETWLAAHYVTVSDQRIKSEQVGSLQATYQGKTDLNLDGSRYGQTAMQLDWAGGLAGMNNRLKKGLGKTVGVTYLGTTPTEAAGTA